MRRRAAATSLALTAALQLAGCGSDESGGADEGPEGDASSSPAAAETASDEPAPAYAEVPDGVELTEPGTELLYGESAVAAWNPRQDVVGVVDVTVAEVQSAQLTRDFAGYDVGGESSPTPYFVRVEVENVGETDLGGRTLPLYALDGGGRLVEQSVIDPDFAPCPGAALPTPFATGATAQACLVFLIPVGGGSRLDDVVLRPVEGVSPLTWNGGIVPYEPRRRPRGRS